MKKFNIVVLSITTALLLASCGNDTTTTSKSETVEKEKRTQAVLELTDMSGREVSFDKNPERIIALTNADMNIIYALGGTVVGRQTTDASGVPDGAKSATEVGNTHDLNLEKIASLGADAIVASSEQNLKDVPAMEGVGPKVVLTGANSIAEIKKQTAVLGELLGKEDKAKELQADIDKKVTKIKEQQKEKNVRALLVLGAPGSNYAALPSSLSGDVLEVAGGDNVAKDFRGVENFPQYASMNVEKIVAADPEVIFLMIHGGDEKETEAAFKKEMKQNDAWNSTSAVKNDHIVVLPAELFGTNPGMKIDEALDYMADEINKVDN
ncbi:ABC transporter substrate-binding protein [Listeria ivanovii]|uniref:ABC transporter substrate-binding protein n=2 Tax=Listeria ivanovii TaxID=1638 RepID=A0ABS1G7F0_LISIV|nr:ABC transporter substrate-binding protein [Listeria ivanovii]EFR95929.1 ferrichrome ABC transporter [Listeria ivanovii FSL F6-596]AIS60747.1 iron-hydroxamate ABC transporter substrate-binding protein [Listeria ivanovii subsp. londoniensis]AIS63574.1 iron-hydroxamate ABC transporter substrate-binding protein [Listeria ivanovii subsp. londoniensis]MBC2255100.1 ABC transporter substrate-binding protein [Listeria ivanovii]MBK1962781.1 ABC transporter substrate-binding protein [Listeria ivanovii